jgi:NADH-quinone oxidoreductase subunit J
MMLNLGRRTLEQERKWLPPAAWRWPSAMAAVLLTELIFVLMQEGRAALGHIVASKEVGIRLLGPYVLAVELASMLLLAGLVGAYHLTRREVKT